MAVTAGSAFAIDAAILPLAFGYGPIHLPSLWVLLQLCPGVRDARHGRIAAHRRRMAGRNWQGLTVAGLLTPLTGRVLNEALFAGRPEVGVRRIVGAGLGLVAINLRAGLFAPEIPADRGRRNAPARASR